MVRGLNLALAPLYSLSTRLLKFTPLLLELTLVYSRLMAKMGGGRAHQKQRSNNRGESIPREHRV